MPVVSPSLYKTSLCHHVVFLQLQRSTESKQGTELRTPQLYHQLASQGTSVCMSSCNSRALCLCSYQFQSLSHAAPSLGQTRYQLQRKHKPMKMTVLCATLRVKTVWKGSSECSTLSFNTSQTVLRG